MTSKIYRGDKLYDQLMSLVGSGPASSADRHPQRFDEILQNFLANQFNFLSLGHYDEFIRMLFSFSTEALIERFFASFLKTCQEELLHSIEKLNADANLEQRITFSSVVSSISDFLSFCINRIFLKPSLHEVSIMFKDPVTRFSEDNVASTMVELLLYRELPFQDNQWMATMMAQFGEGILGAGNPLFAKVVSRISSNIMSNYILHDRATKQTTPLLDAWFFEEIIKPLQLFDKKMQAARIDENTTDTALLDILLKEYGSRVQHLKDNESIQQDILKIVRTAFEQQG
jgi:hypothetical protein